MNGAGHYMLKILNEIKIRQKVLHVLSDCLFFTSIFSYCVECKSHCAVYDNSLTNSLSQVQHSVFLCSLHTLIEATTLIALICKNLDLLFNKQPSAFWGALKAFPVLTPGHRK